jgi:leucyl aminopeptidase
MIELMKFDMGGCAAILGCALAISELPLKNIEVDFISPVCENMVDANAMRPGDIIKYRNGKSVEILNTDAEGRLCLADALIYAQNNIKYEDGANNTKPDVILDLATLTGACMIALGDKYAGLYTSSTELREDLIDASFSANEKVWHMPLEPEYKENIKGKTADLKNIGGPYGGSITAALFLQEFIDPSLSSTKWAHIDMAGPVWNMSESKATGFGVKLLVEYLLKLQQKQN